MSRRARRTRLLVSAFGIFLTLLVSIGAAMPAYARLLGGPHAHACNCEIRRGHSQCACALCFPELNDVDTYGAPSLTGRCGTDDPGWRTLSSPAVPSSDFVLIAPLAHVAVSGSPPLSATQWAERPELPPPRA